VIVLVDNYDSFVHNLARYFEELGQETIVVRNDAITIDEIRERRPDSIVLSPGPCDPPKAGISLDVVRELGGEIPILGVCLGHQAIAEAYGGHVVRGEPRHGRTSEIHHGGKSVFEGLPNPFIAARYHSLQVSSERLPDCLEVTAVTPDGYIMGLRHREHPVVGVQFHPESALTQFGHRLLANFLQSTGAPIPESFVPTSPLSESA